MTARDARDDHLLGRYDDRLERGSMMTVQKKCNEKQMIGAISHDINQQQDIAGLSTTNRAWARYEEPSFTVKQIDMQ